MGASVTPRNGTKTGKKLTLPTPAPISDPSLSEYTFAYQPIVNIKTREIDSFEALVRGLANESAKSVLSKLSPTELRLFDIEARQRAIELADQLGLPCRINLNLLPDSVQFSGREALESTIQAAETCGFDPDRLVLELSESETIADFKYFVENVDRCRSIGVHFSIDDFGAGYSGLNLLAEFQPESIKLDMVLVRDIMHRGPRQAIIRGVIRTCEDLAIDIVAEGVETLDEYHWLRDEGIFLFQGHLFAEPGFRSLPEVVYPD